MSDHDYLTHLYNRRYFDAKLAEYRHSDFMPLGFIIMDINGLKLINDAFGHDVGDRLLIDVAERLAPFGYGGNIIARIGSDEYGILCPNVTNELMESMSRQIKRLFLDLKTNGVAISTSVGWSIQFDPEESQRLLIKIAEDYMNRNKLFAAPSIRGNTVYAIVNTLHEKNAREEQHSQRVGALSQKLGEMLGLSARELSELKAMGTLHDIGKVAIDEKILNKPGKLSREEYEEIKRHPEIGYRILSSVNELGEIAEYVLAHHESWDGSGYPRGLTGAKIPFLSRVIAIADAYDAMTSNRTYRDAVSREAALGELERCSGKQFDPEIVRVFVSKIDYIE
jgi:diguanylate cyclase (GGDEF)-like protein